MSGCKIKRDVMSAPRRASCSHLVLYDNRGLGVLDNSFNKIADYPNTLSYASHDIVSFLTLKE